MATINRHLAAAALGLAVFAAATPSFAAEQDNVSAARERALRECSAEVKGYRQYTWGDHEITGYRTCMNQHGQQE